MKIIFLDIDGVLNSELFAREVKDFCYEWPEGTEGIGHHEKFCPRSKALLNSLIEKTDAKIVISSSWRLRGLEYMKTVWKLENMSGEIIGMTPILRGDGFTVPRGVEIDRYLESIGFSHIFYNKDLQRKYMQSSGVENYIIIDDDPDMLIWQSAHFVNVLPAPRNIEGFNQKYYEQALSILSKNLIDIHFNQ